MKMLFRARFLVFLLVLSTPLASSSFAQTSIYKAPVSGPSAGTQRVALTYRAIFDIPAPVDGEVTVTIPFPADDEVQHVEKYSFGSAMPPEKLLSVSLQRDAVYGNRFWEIRVLNPTISDVLTFEYVISRKEKSNPLDVPIKADARITPAEDMLLSVRESSEVLLVNSAMASLQLVTKGMSRDESIRAIYRYGVENVGGEWEKFVKQGGENRLSILVARAAKIAAKPEIGVLIPAGKDLGEIGQAHAWANLFHPQHGWIPIDVIEGARKKRYVDYYLGNIDSDHISFAIGDDAQLVPTAMKQRDGIPMKMKISFKRLPNSNPMIAPDQSSGVE